MARHVRRRVRWGRAAVVVFIALVLSWGLTTLARALGLPTVGWLTLVLAGLAVLLSVVLAPWYLQPPEDPPTAPTPRGDRDR
jgi:hypothetical protein